MNTIDYIANILKIFAGDNRNIGVYSLLQYLAVVIGMVLLFIAMTRLTKHGKTQQMFRYYAPSTTIFMFFSGIMFLSMGNFIQMVSNTLFYNLHDYMNPTNRIAEYVKEVIHLKDAELDIAQRYLIFSLLSIVGFISILRGMFLLITSSEGQHQGGVSHIISHIVAGIVGMNAGFLWGIVQSIGSS
ncbi:hypothetical protein [Fangia hongkongensis]|uniref:hypothetical protein n=1 Tax=Fangia hongkongensis TaxID=270495 RepID=UPI0003692558|nr:hypothetical protein [Fangia hongkongensis]MBK2124241.1 hypothetical protein [Fangia hongkongensis]